MNKTDKVYTDLLVDIRDNGALKGDRTGTGTTSVFGRMVKFDMKEGFPLLTTKKIHTRSVIHELLWFLKGDTNTKYLNDNGVTIWDEWSRNVGDYPNNSRLDKWIRIKPTIDYVQYDGDYSTDGVNAKKDSIDDKLRNIWVKMMKRCYKSDSHNYRFYGEKGVFVDKRWHSVSSFIEDVKQLQNWDLKEGNWDLYELDKDYYGAKYYSKDTCVFLHTAENNIYNGNPIKIIFNGEEKIYHSYKDAEVRFGVPSTTLHRWCNDGLPTVMEGDNKGYEGIEISEITKDGYVYRKSFTDGDLGPVYGKQWVNWSTGKNESVKTGETYPSGEYKYDINKKGINQIQYVIDRLTNFPDCRRIMVNAWNPAEINDMALMPCHYGFQFWTRDLSLEERNEWHVRNNKKFLIYDGDDDEEYHGLLDDLEIPRRGISLSWNQRSVDTFLGLPFNIASYALLLEMVGQQVGMAPLELTGFLGDTHLYSNHMEQIETQLSRDSRPLPRLKLKKADSIFDYKFEDFEFEDYNPHPAIKAPIAI